MFKLHFYQKKINLQLFKIVTCGLLLVFIFCTNKSSAQFNFNFINDLGNPRTFDTINNKLVFIANHPTFSDEIWVSDGTVSGTQLLIEINPDPGWGSNITRFVHFNNKLYFSAFNGTNGELWSTDGTLAGTTLEIPNFTGSSYHYVLNNKLLFEANTPGTGQELWIVDTNMVSTIVDIVAGSDGSLPSRFTVLNDSQMVFTVVISGNSQLWVTNGTEIGTTFLADPNPSAPELFREFVTHNDKVYFNANDGLNGDELWVTDGTVIGTHMVADIFPGAQPSSPTGITSDGTKLYFSAYDGANGVEPWISDGTATGTILLKDIYTLGDGGSSSPSNFTPFNNKVLFQANDFGYGEELWVTDGTASGTYLLKDINPGPTGSGCLHESIIYNNLLFFRAYDGTPNGYLWVTDLTPTNTIAIAPFSLTLGSSCSIPNTNTFGVYNNELFLGALFNTPGCEFWKVNGSFPTSINPVLNDGINIFPNPTREWLNIEGLELGALYSIYDMQGRLIQSEVAKSKSQKFNIEALNNGSYLFIGNEIRKIFIVNKF